MIVILFAVKVGTHSNIIWMVRIFFKIGKKD